jgi:hypothetical protein
MATDSRTREDITTSWLPRKVGPSSMNGADERYLQQLRLLAANWLNFDNSTRSAMKSASFVLGAQHVPVKSRPAEKSWLGGKTSEAPVEEYEVEWVLCKASDVSLILSFLSPEDTDGRWHSLTTSP